MSFSEAVKSAFTNYCKFTGRARRSEYWYFVLFNMLVNAVIMLLGRLAGDKVSSVLSTIYSLAVLLPGLGLCWRRMHDVGKSGGYIFMCLIPLVGWILVLVKLCTDSEPLTNRFGPNPKAVETDGGESGDYNYQA